MFNFNFSQYSFLKEKYSFVINLQILLIIFIPPTIVFGPALGDILLSLFIGGYLGIVNGLFCLFLASIAGLLYALFLKSKLSKEPSTKIPFGTCLSLSFIVITLLEICIDFRLTLF